MGGQVAVIPRTSGCTKTLRVWYRCVTDLGLSLIKLLLGKKPACYDNGMG